MSHILAYNLRLTLIKASAWKMVTTVTMRTVLLSVWHASSHGIAAPTADMID